MKPFFRYLIHFLSILLILGFAAYILGKPRVPFFQAAICFCLLFIVFALPMAWYFSLQESKCVVEYCGDMNAIIAKLDQLLESNTDRTCVEKSETTRVYAFSRKNALWLDKFPFIVRYNRWLTENVVITKNDSSVTVTGPQAILKKISIDHN